jgi:RNA polymerase sigma factor (sigma-70 family)
LTVSDPSFQTAQLQHWVERLQAGDLAARDELLRCVCERMEHLARHMLKGFPNVKRWADTDDVMQSALLRLLNTLNKLKPASVRDFFNLAAVHVRRELVDLARYHGSRHGGRGRMAGGSPDDNAELLAEIPARDDDPADADLWARFHEAVERLPAEEREVIGLVFYHGWDQAQIAELFAVSDRTVRRRWQAACDKLHESLGGRLPELNS